MLPGGLPLEELLFFVVVPTCSVLALRGGPPGAGLAGRGRVSYTALAVVGVAGALVLDLVVLRTRLVRRRAFWTAYAIVLVFQLLTNGWLTGRDIVTLRRRGDPRRAAGLRAGRGPAVRVLAGAADAGLVGLVGPAPQPVRRADAP